MNSFINKTLSVAIIFGLVIVMGVLAVFAETNSGGIHTPEIEINVYSPITEMFDCELNVNIQSLFEITTHEATHIQTFDILHVPCEDVLAAHQKRIDSILALICEYGIDNLHDLSVFLQTLQNEGNYVPIIQSACAGHCVVVPVWVTINGVRHPGYRCITCGRVFITS